MHSNLIKFVLYCRTLIFFWFLCELSKNGIKSEKRCSCGHFAGTIQKWKKMCKFMEKAKCGGIKLGSCCISFCLSSFALWSHNIPYILESNPHPFYSSRGLKKSDADYNCVPIRFVVESWILEKL